MRVLGGLLILSFLCAAPVFAQSPTTPAHPSLPWALGVAIPQGQMIRQTQQIPGAFVRDIWIAPQPVVVDAMVALPVQANAGAGAESQDKGETQYGVLRQNFTVPGYYVRETTVGFHYPERWILDQSYAWRLMPAEFRPHGTVFNPGWPPAPLTAPTLGSANSAPAPLVVPTLR
jgi:hypothetical protein